MPKFYHAHVPVCSCVFTSVIFAIIQHLSIHQFYFTKSLHYVVYLLEDTVFKVVSLFYRTRRDGMFCRITFQNRTIVQH